MYRVQGIWQERNRSECKRCCCAKAVATAAAVAAWQALSDDKPQPPPLAECAPLKKVTQPAPAGPVHEPPVQSRCLIANFFGVATSACSGNLLRDPTRFALDRRADGTQMVAHARQWLASAADMQSSPGVLATAGVASAVPTLVASLPAGALWFAAVSLFSAGAVDAFVERQIQQRLAQARVAASASAEALHPTASSSSARSPEHVAAVAPTGNDVRGVRFAADHVPSHAKAAAAFATMGTLAAATRRRPPQAATRPTAPASGSAPPQLHVLDVSSYFRPTRRAVW